ncbi:8272_t:CDS:2, partial [Scutellospora calospora]
ICLGGKVIKHHETSSKTSQMLSRTPQTSSKTSQISSKLIKKL